MNSRIHGIALSAAEQQMGRLMRAPDEHAAPGGGGGGDTTTQNQQQNNGGGNNADSETGGKSDENNAGQDPALAGFWSDPKPKEGAGGESEPAKGGGEQKGGEGGSDHGKQLVARLAALKFDDVITPEIADQLAKDELGGANERFGELARESIRQSVVMSAQLMQVFGQQVMQQVEGMIQKALGNRDDDQSLIEAFPAARDPAARPLIQSVFQQALKHKGGDRAEAIKLARDMLKLVGSKAAGEFGLETPAGSREDFLGDAPAALVEELLARN